MIATAAGYEHPIAAFAGIFGGAETLAFRDEEVFFLPANGGAALHGLGLFVGQWRVLGGLVVGVVFVGHGCLPFVAADAMSASSDSMTARP
ncbi:MAG: hypothetical protein U0904_03910 [Candidatus Nanopelagicales bacterium]|nr:hypothetical protein [Candidatus Nanopelagicales bacterium]